jgi:hypothetical protein
VDYYTAEHPSVTWKVEEPIAGLSERLVWSLGVRRSEAWELDSFLRMLKESGSCTVVVEDPGGEVLYFPCNISMHEVAIVGHAVIGHAA